MNKVMLIYPPGRLYQRSEDRAQSNIEDSATASVHACNDLGYCAAILKSAGYEVFLRDYQTEKAHFKDVMNNVLRFRPDIIFLSTTNATVLSDLAFIARVKQYYNCKIFFKGAIFYNTPAEIFEKVDFSAVDCLIGGEVEFIILPLVNYYLKNQGDIKEIGGIIYNESGRFVPTFFDTWNSDLDSLPFPDRSAMNNALYVRPDTGEPMATISVARGCPSNCIYCLTPIISGKKVRFRSIENVFAEIEECYYKYGISNFFFKADTFTINKQWAMALCQRIIDSELFKKIKFTANARADSVSPELLQKMKHAGCFMLAVGFESGSQKSLKMMRKNISLEQNLNAAKMIKEAKIPLFGFFMIGFPWETIQDIEQTRHLIFQIDADFIEVHIAMPYFGTQLYDCFRQNALLTDLSYGFDYYNPNTKGTVVLPTEIINAAKKDILLHFYGRVRYVLKKTCRALKQPIVLYHYFVYAKHLIKNNVFRS